jgi:hypothetical protein
MKNSSVTKLCIVLAFVPGLISVVIIGLDVVLPNWVSVLTIDLPAFLSATRLSLVIVAALGQVIGRGARPSGVANSRRQFCSDFT